MKRLMLLAAVLGFTSWGMAQEHAPATGPAGEGAASRTHAAGDSHPVLPQNATWAGSMMILVIAMFVAAAVIGVVVRLNMPEPQAHDDHGHDDHTHAGGHGHGHDDHSKGHGH